MKSIYKQMSNKELIDINSKMDKKNIEVKVQIQHELERRRKKYGKKNI